MPYRENYINPNPYGTPEPHFKPAYTGWIPGFGPLKQYLPPKCYEVATYELMKSHRIAGERLNFILQVPKEDEKARQDEDYYVQLHEGNSTVLKRRRDMVPGYCGHIPRNQNNIGMTFARAVKKATADFFKLKSEGNE